MIYTMNDEMEMDDPIEGVETPAEEEEEGEEAI